MLATATGAFVYDQEMGKSLSESRILAALAVLSASATASLGCSKSESARPVEEMKPMPAATASAAVTAAPVVATAAAATGESNHVGGSAVDAGKELAPAPPSSALKRSGAHAMCGAQGCSPDMKKGN